MNIVFILIDSLRYDVVVDNLAKLKGFQTILQEESGEFYKNVFSSAGWTQPAMSSMFSGIYPGRHGPLHLNPKFRLLHEYLNELDYITGFCSSNAYFSEMTGVARSFIKDYYWNRKNFLKKLNLVVLLKSIFGDRNEINRKILHLQGKKFIKDNRRQKFFLYLHHEVHAPYKFYKSNISELKRKYGMKQIKKISSLSKNVWYFMENKVSDEDRKCLFDLYRMELINLDRYILNLIDYLKKLKLFEKTMIIISSDHGEHFGENGIYGHNLTLFDEIIRVPLLIKYPTGTLLRDKEFKLCSTVDIMPTILSLIGISYKDIDGINILSEDERKYVISERSVTLRHYQEWKRKFPDINIDKWNYYLISLRSLDMQYIEKINLDKVEVEYFSLLDGNRISKKSNKGFEFLEQEMKRYKNRINVPLLLQEWCKNQHFREEEQFDKAALDQLKGLGYFD